MTALEHPNYHSVGPADAILLGILRELIAIHEHLEESKTPLVSAEDAADIRRYINEKFFVQPASSTEAATPAQPASRGKRAVLPSK